MLRELSFKRRVRYEKHIRTWEEFVHWLQNALKNRKYVYRGINRSEYLCISSFYRYFVAKYQPDLKEIIYNVNEKASEILPEINAEDFLRDSFEIIMEFNSQLVHQGAIENELPFGDACTIAQHYELPTNLIDFTLDPVIALFFACSGEDDFDAAVFESDIWHPIRVINAENQHGVRGYYKDPEKAHAELIRCLTSIDQTTQLSLTTPEILPSMLVHNERIKRQSGVFVYNAEIFPYDRIMYNFWDYPYATPGRTVYIIDKSLKPIIREHLKNVGVTWETLMPSEDGKEIKNAVKETKLKLGIPDQY